MTIAHLMGYALHADRPHKNIGPIRAGARTTVRMTVRNIRSQPTTIVGVETNCGCAAVNLDTLPMELQPGEKHELVLEVGAADTMKGRRLTVRVRVFTDAPGPILSWQCTAQVE